MEQHGSILREILQNALPGDFSTDWPEFPSRHDWAELWTILRNAPRETRLRVISRILFLAGDAQRLAALDLLEECDQDDPGYLTALCDARRNLFPTVRCKAVELLAAVPDPRVEGELRRSLKDECPDVRRRAVRLLAVRCGESAADWIAPRLGDEEETVRRVTGQALADVLAPEDEHLQEALASLHSPAGLRRARSFRENPDIACRCLLLCLRFAFPSVRRPCLDSLLHLVEVLPFDGLLQVRSELRRRHLGQLIMSDEELDQRGELLSAVESRLRPLVHLPRPSSSTGEESESLPRPAAPPR